MRLFSNIKLLFIILLLATSVTTKAHEDHNETFSPEGYFWTWNPSLIADETYTWNLEVWDDGNKINDGKIDITILKDLSDENLLNYFEINDNQTFDVYTNAFFDISYDEDIEYYSEVYAAKYLIAPIMFHHENGTIYNLLNSSLTFDDLYVGLINETIDLTCIQGCHTELDNPFSTKYVDSYLEDELFVVEGGFVVNNFTGSELYGYDTGEFRAEYTLEGILESWYWESDDSLEKLVISRDSLSSKDKFMLTYFVGIPILLFGVAMVYAIRVIIPNLTRTKVKSID